MLNMLQDVKTARQEAEQMLAEGVHKRLPLAYVHFVISLMLARKDLPVPDDLLAWISQGRVSDKQVDDWRSPVGV